MPSREQGRLNRIYANSHLKAPYHNWPLAKRLLMYQNERVPVLALFTMGLILYAAISHISQPSPNWSLVLLATLLSTLYFIQVRLADEPKDYEHDTRHHTTRPIQRGLVTLTELRSTKRIVIGLFLLLACLSGSVTIVLLAALQQVCAFITHREFFVRTWLRQHFFAYQFSHYAQLLLLGWLTTTTLGINDSDTHLLYYGYVLAMSIPIELSRTIGGTDDKKANDRYSHKLGVKIAIIWFLVSIAIVATYTIMLAQPDPITALLPLAFGLLAVGYASFHYILKPISKNANTLGLSSILFYFASSGTLLMI